MYVDGFVIPMQKKKLPAYVKMASAAGKVWHDYGALAYFECVGDDLNIENVGSFLKPFQCKKDETIVFAWITYKSKADRIKINKLVMADPRIAGMAGMEMPFDPQRMCYGGFETIVVHDKPAKKVKKGVTKAAPPKSATKKATTKKR
jgi:uncharacterized protein YbaA (DUF1428 family)